MTTRSVSRRNQLPHARQKRHAAGPRRADQKNTSTLAPTAGIVGFTDHHTGVAIPDLPPPLPCPFCGSAGLVGIVEDESEDDNGPCSLCCVQCDHCGIQGPGAYSKAEAATLWNTRPAAQARISPAAESVWSTLDDSNQAIVKAKALLMTIKIALRNPDDQINEEDVQSSLGVLGELLDAVADGIDTAQSAAHSRHMAPKVAV